MDGFVDVGLDDVDQRFDVVGDVVAGLPPI